MQVTEVLPEFATAFPFPTFNEMQRETLPALLTTNENVVVSAPTASGKTALAELAICKTLKEGGTALFLAPLRSLTNEKEREWDRFEELGYSVYVVTGERDLAPRQAARADVLVMTPEKADSATRKHDSNRYRFMSNVDCCVIDEVHLLDSERRGSVLEVTIARLRRICDPRIIALSATMPNTEDVAAWLDAPPDTTFAFDDSYRPVPLHANVKTYTHGDNAFADKYRRLYRALDLIEPHLRDNGQGLVFVSSRQDTVQAAKKARDELGDRNVPLGERGDFTFHEETQVLGNETLRQLVLDGIAFHHAGLSRTDKNHVERWFREGRLPLLFSTSTLAWGVNLPARCVVIRDTKFHDPLEGEVDMSPIDVLQMLGRAGRPEYDTVGYGWIVCDAEDADRYRQLLDEGTPIESRLAGDIDAHLVAEVALGTIRDLDDVLEWLQTTYYYVRAQSQPAKYEFSELQDRIRTILDNLITQGFLETESLGLEATSLGQLTSIYYLRLETALRFHELAQQGTASTDAILDAVAGAAEFNSVNARTDERDVIKSIVESRDELSAGTEKVLAILNASMSGTVPSSLSSDAWVIKQNSLRLLSALRAFFDQFGDARGSNQVSRIEARLTHGMNAESIELMAIDGVGPGRAETLVDAGLTSLSAIRDAGVDPLVDAGLSDGVAARLISRLDDLPAITIEWGDFPVQVEVGHSELHEVTIRTTAGGARVGVRVTVNDVEMTLKDVYLVDDFTLPIGVFGADCPQLEFSIEVVVPELPIPPFTEHRVVQIHDPA